MKKKIVIWGTNAKEEKVLVGIELLAEENQIQVNVIPEAHATTASFDDLMDKWRLGQEYSFSEGTDTQVRPLSVTEGLLPEDIKVEKSDLIVRAQAEWHFVVLSSKLHDAYKSELEDFKDKVEKITEFDPALWNGLKGFWNKVQDQSNEKNLFRDHANSLRNGTNELFSRLKEMRAVLDEEFRNQSKNYKEEFFNLIGEVETKVKENVNLNRLFDDLKKIQQKYKDTKFTKEDRNKVWDKLDGAFKTVKEKKYGPQAAQGNSPVERTQRRYDGLMGASQKMERSIKRDKDELAFQDRRINRTEGQLELQIRQAKTKMLEERMKSKEEKLADMLATKKDLEGRLAKQKAKAEQFAKKAAASATVKEDKKAKAETKTETKKEEGKSSESVVDALGATLGESFGDIIDTVKAVAEVVGDKVTEAVTEFAEDMKEAQAARKGEEEEE